MADDDFAKDVSEFDTLDEYKADIKAKLTKKNQENAVTQTPKEGCFFCQNASKGSRYKRKVRKQKQSI